MTTDPARVSGRQYGRGVTLNVFCSNSKGGAYWVDYDLARRWSRFNVVAGLSDASPTTSTATFTVLVDGRPVAGEQVTLGQAVPIDVPVDGALRLRLRSRDSVAGTVFPGAWWVMSSSAGVGLVERTAAPVPIITAIASIWLT